MNNGFLQYSLHTFTGLIEHGWPKAAFLRDTAEDQQDSATSALEAQVRSGDYFVTLAMTLDSLGKNGARPQVRVGLENVVSDLIYLQDHYTITKNKQSE